VTEHRETYRVGPDEAGEGPPSPSRRFARLVESPGSRRASPRRLARAVAASVVGLAVVGFGGARLLRSLTGWVGNLPEYQLMFSRIELIPEPPPYIRGGTAGFLGRVRDEARRGETLPLLADNLASLKLDFLHSPWVRGVTKVERSPGRLAVHLAYRKPVAVAESEKGRAAVIDEEGVILPMEDRDIDWVNKKGPDFRVRGIDGPLIEIHDVSQPAGTLAGLRWKRTDGELDLQVQGAARLAAFLVSRGPRTAGGRAVPRFVGIFPDAETLRFHLVDAENHIVFWGEAPGAEAHNMPTSDARWSMLTAWIDEHGSLALKPGQYLAFDHSGARVGQFDRSARPKRASGG